MTDAPPEAFETLIKIIQELLVNEEPCLELVASGARPKKGQLSTKPEIFHAVFQILGDAGFLEDDVRARGPDVNEPLPIVHPRQSLNPLARLHLEQLSCASALLKAFSLLRIRYQHPKQSDRPRVVLIARAGEVKEVDGLYLIGDAITERYPVEATLTREQGELHLALEGRAREGGEGFFWDRSGYILSRDASLIIRPLREALRGTSRPLIIPRWTVAEDAVIRARIPQGALQKIQHLTFITSLHCLKDQVFQEPPLGPAGELGDHWHFRSGSNGYVVSDGPIQDVLPVRRRWRGAGDTVPREEGPDLQLAITFEGLGGVREIGANAYYYRFGRRGLLIDAGYDANLDGWLGLPALERITRLDAIIITHGHLDHIGSIPLLARLFPNVPIYTTTATLDVFYATLNDSVNIAKYRFEDTGEQPALHGGLVSRLSRERFETRDYGQSFPLAEIPGLQVTFHDAGHVIGSIGVEMRFGGAKIFHTGDISVEDQHLLRGMSLAPLEGHVVMEGTYGGNRDTTRVKRRLAVDEFLAHLGERISKGGTVLIPSFSLGRAQEVLAMIQDWAKEKNLSFPIYAVGGQTISINEISKRRKQFFPKLRQDPFQFKEWPRLKSEPFQQAAEAFEEELRKVAAAGPAVIIASHGMLMRPTGSYMLARAILRSGDDRHAIFLCGYMDPRTPGFRLINQKNNPQIRLCDDDIVTPRLPPERIEHHSLSAHASYEELIEVALRATSSVTLVHGDETALDTLKQDLSGRFASQGKQVPIQAPGLGERVLLERVPAPEGWEVDVRPQVLPTLTPERTRDRRGLYLRGITPDPLKPERAWALIPVGEPIARLAVQTERLDVERIESVVVSHPSFGKETLFERAKGQGRLSDLHWSKLGSWTWAVHFRNSEGNPEHGDFPIECGAELRPLRLVMDAPAPVLDLAVGGRAVPGQVQLGPRAPVALQKSEWDPVGRILRLTLEPHDVGPIEPLVIRVGWPNYTQSGPAIEGLRFEPLVQLTPGPARVGEPLQLTVKSTPSAQVARVGKREVSLSKDQLELVPLEPGPLKISLGYGPPSARVWTFIDEVEVAPSVEVTHPDLVEVGKPVDVRIRALSRELRGLPAILEIDGKVRDRWTVGSEPHTWSGVLETEGTLGLRIRVPTQQWVLCESSLEALSGLALLTRGTAVTTADGKVEARLKWFKLTRTDQAALEEVFRQAGFEPMKWDGTTLHLRGTEETLGMKEVVVGEGSHTIKLQVLTLTDDQLQLEREGPYFVGEGIDVRLAAQELSSGLKDVDGGPLTLQVMRVQPLRDSLSSEQEGPRVRPLHPGTYEIALMAGSQRLAEHRFEVSLPLAPKLPPGKQNRHFLKTNATEAAMCCADLTADTPIAVVRAAPSSFEVRQDDADRLEDEAWISIQEGLKENESILMLSHGLSLHHGSGRLLRRLWVEQPQVQTARLSYPAPQGRIWQAGMESNRPHERVLCYLPANARIDIGDAFACPRCSARPTLKTRQDQVFLSCPGCAWEDEKTIVTLDQMRRRNAQVLCTEYRMFRYLSSGRGKRYAGSFGRTVRCGRCQSLQGAFPSLKPWSGAELMRLLVASAWAWNQGGEDRFIQRAARHAAQRLSGATVVDTLHFEDLLQRLTDENLLSNGQPQGDLSPLERGRSFCCDAELAWSTRRMRVLIFGIEELLAKGHPALHPDLPGGSTGLQRLLSMTS